MAYEVRIYDRDGTARAVLPATVDIEVELGGLGSGTLQVPATSTKYLDDPTLLDDGNIVEVRDGPTTTTWMIDGMGERAYLSGDQPTGAPVQVGLVGAIALLSHATLDAENGMSERAADLRPFGPARYGFDDSSWVTPADGGTQDNPNFNRDTSFPEGWSDPDARYIHPTSDGTATVASGRGLLRAEFTLPAEDELTLQVTVDEELPTLWVAGKQPIPPIAGQLYQWQRTFSESWKEAAGNHAVFAVVHNIDRPSGLLNIAHLLFSLTDSAGNVILRSDTANWTAYPTYPVVAMPGDTPGTILDIAIDEAETRGSLPTIARGYTASADSDGVAWSHETSMAWPVRTTSVLRLLTDLMEITDIDHAALHFVSGQLQLDVWQTYGTDRTVGTDPVRLQPGVAVTGATVGRQPPGPNDVWTRTAGGWTQTQDTDAQTEHGLIEGGDVVAVADIPEAYGQAGQKVLARTSARPRHRLDVTDTDQVTAGTHWWIGDTILIPDDTGTLVAGRVLRAAPADSRGRRRWQTIVERTAY